MIWIHPSEEEVKMYPRYKHDCSGCEFLGHWFGYDVYVCTHAMNIDEQGSILARHGNEGHQYASIDLKLFRDMIRDNQRICGQGFSLPFNDYLFSPHVIAYHKAWLLGLSLLKPTKKES